MRWDNLLTFNKLKKDRSILTERYIIEKNSLSSSVILAMSWLKNIYRGLNHGK